ncbi:hypothetical protein GE061_019205 [Apolygus lucorum]|uniref:Uncharacterized protein n=1 Tax=Apolygus lucorum TaxID=248454 RepID=A0A8S9X9N9_APOLU|nr:hypothetical protein GE061_019205 [Apolygus lucorum]
MDRPVGWAVGPDLDRIDVCDEEGNAPSPPGAVGGGDVDCVEDEEDDEDDEDFCGVEELYLEDDGDEEPNLDFMNVSGGGVDYNLEDEEEDLAPRAAYSPTEDLYLEDYGEEEPEVDYMDDEENACGGQEWTPLPPKRHRKEYNEYGPHSVDFNRMQRWRDFRVRFGDARLQCGGTPSGYTTVRPFGVPGGFPTMRVRPLSERVSRRIDFSTATGKPRNRLRYMKKRFNEGMSRLRGARDPPIGCEACGGPRRCHLGILDEVDPHCHPKIKRPKWPDFEGPEYWIAYAELFHHPDYCMSSYGEYESPI